MYHNWKLPKKESKQINPEDKFNFNSQEQLIDAIQLKIKIKSLRTSNYIKETLIFILAENFISKLWLGKYINLIVKKF
jgi:hypothetical protein